MEPFKPARNVHKGPEAQIQAAFGKYLEKRGWHVQSTHGNAFQSGFPDDRASHAKWGGRWIEYKLPPPHRFALTPAQRTNFPKMLRTGDPIWIIVAATDEEYDKLFLPCNAGLYLGADAAGFSRIDKYLEKIGNALSAPVQADYHTPHERQA